VGDVPAVPLPAAASVPEPAGRLTLLFPPRAAVVVGGIPGAGKTTLLRRAVRSEDARVLDSADVRDALRRRIGGWAPYRVLRPLVHAGHLIRVWRALGAGDPVVVHECATRAWLRRAMVRRARAAGRPVFLLLLHVEPALARSNQIARRRTVRRGTMRRHERRWRELVGDDGALLASAAPRGEGFASVRVLRRADADAVEALRFAPQPAPAPPAGTAVRRRIRSQT
jgi:predicted kinase